METSPKKYTVESLTELIRQDPEKAFEITQQIPEDELEVLLGALPFKEFCAIQHVAIVENLAANIAAKVETP